MLEHPPELPDQADSEESEPSVSVRVVVPPTATTLGEAAGYPALFPSSPVDAKNETPAAAPEVKTFSK